MQPMRHDTSLTMYGRMRANIEATMGIRDATDQGDQDNHEAQTSVLERI